MNNYISKPDREKLEKLFEDGASRVDSYPEHWVCGGEESLSYCYECCSKEVDRLSNLYHDDEFLVDGGWGTEGDSALFCEDCGKLLENTLTEWGCVEEVEHFLENGFDPYDDDNCRAMSEVISANGWEPIFFFNKPGWQKESKIKYFEDLHKLCRIILITIKGE